jgi:hypothetical protein
VLIECGSVVVGCHVTDVALACCVKKGEGKGEGSSRAPELMWTVMTVVSSLDDVAHSLKCQVISVSRWAADVALACVKKGEGAGEGSNCAPEVIVDSDDDCVVTVWMMWHIR